MSAASISKNKALTRQLGAASNSEKGANIGMSFFTLRFIHTLLTSLAHERAGDKQQSLELLRVKQSPGRLG